jgi:hypothetical protein
MKRLGALLFALFAISAHAQDQRISFKGIALGATKAEYIAAFPDFVCKEDSCAWQPYFCANRGGDACLTRNEWAGVVPNGVLSEFTDGKLSSVSIFFTAKAYSQVASAARERYGAPAIDQRLPFQTKGGGKFNNRHMGWMRADTHLNLVLYTRDLDESTAIIQTRAASEAFGNEMKARAKANAANM